MSSTGLKLRYSAQSDVGQKRAHNEDSFCAMASESFFAVADGMGGHAGGGIASKIAIETLSSVILSRQEDLRCIECDDADLESSPVAKLLSDALRGACRAIFQEAKVNPSLQGMGTTATCLLFHNQNVFIGHVGDSRAYLLRDGQFLQLSEDHSLINEQLKAGLITSEQAKQSRFRNIITRSVGFEEDVDVDMIALKALTDDVFFLSTDGLTGLVGDDEIHHVLAAHDLETSARMLIDLANKRGGDDNITAVIVKVLAGDLAAIL